MIYFAKIHLGTFKVKVYGRGRINPDREMCFIKIGTSIHPLVRIRQLAFEYGKPMVLLACIPGGPSEEAEMHERFSHLRFLSTPRSKPEWFYPVPELMDFIKNLSAMP